jgi:hypothetical protein
MEKGKLSLTMKGVEGILNPTTIHQAERPIDVMTDKEVSPSGTIIQICKR